MSAEHLWNALGAAVFVVAAGLLMTTMSLAAIHSASFSPGAMCHSSGCYEVASR